MTMPADGLDFHEKQRINADLLSCGAHIGEMNCVRKHLSKIKGGRLAVACAPAQLLTLAISDVPGDDPGVIASGPTVPDSSTSTHALEILRRYKIEIPDNIRVQLEQGDLETPKDGDPAFADARVDLIATPWQSLEAAAESARAMGLSAYILSDEMEGESREVGKVHAALARSVARRNSPFQRPCVILSGGETTVAVKPQTEGAPRGRGGRAGEFCLGLVQALQAEPNVWALAADTDGIDGVQDNAGAFVTPDSLSRASAVGASVVAHLDRNDAYGYFQALDDLLVTGPTYTNVNDFRAILIR
jgi:hydroxypyruvate reductase